MQGKMLEIPVIKKTKEKELSKYNMNTLNFNFV